MKQETQIFLSTLVFCFLFLNSQIALSRNGHNCPNGSTPIADVDGHGTPGCTDGDGVGATPRDDKKINEAFAEKEVDTKKLEEIDVKDYNAELKKLLEMYGREPVNEIKDPNSGQTNKEIDYGSLNPSSFFDKRKNDSGKQTSLGAMPETCHHLATQNQDGITFVRPNDVNQEGAVLFNGEACSGVKRTKSGAGFEHNSWPSSSVEGTANMFSDGERGESANFKKGSYGDSNNDALSPVWLGDSGAVQIHSLRGLEGDASVAGVSSKGCLVVNQNCMQAINAFAKENKDAKFKIVEDNGECAAAVRDS